VVMVIWIGGGDTEDWGEVERKILEFSGKGIKDFVINGIRKGFCFV
jgi:hypothetical protein